MTDEYRHKLLQWIASALMLVAIAVLSLCAQWISRIQNINPSAYEVGFADHFAGQLGEALLFYPYAFVPTLLWHLADFAEQSRPVGKRVKFLTRYPVLAWLILLLGLTYFLHATAWFKIIGTCGGAYIVLTQACSWTHPVVSVPLQSAYLAIWLLTLLKLAVAVRSGLRAPR
jgi:hypothetical protein